MHFKKRDNNILMNKKEGHAFKVSSKGQINIFPDNFININ